jgi:hypothetical protein
VYESVQDNPLSINGLYERERGNLDGFRELPFESQTISTEYNSEQEVSFTVDVLVEHFSLYTTPREQDNLDIFRELPYN